jgi:hypothetical protein
MVEFLTPSSSMMVGTPIKRQPKQLKKKNVQARKRSSKAEDRYMS